MIIIHEDVFSIIDGSTFRGRFFCANTATPTQRQQERKQQGQEEKGAKKIITRTQQENWQTESQRSYSVATKD